MPRNPLYAWYTWYTWYTQVYLWLKSLNSFVISWSHLKSDAIVWNPLRSIETPWDVFKFHEIPQITFKSLLILRITFKSPETPWNPGKIVTLYYVELLWITVNYLWLLPEIRWRTFNYLYIHCISWNPLKCIKMSLVWCPMIFLDFP